MLAQLTKAASKLEEPQSIVKCIDLTLSGDIEIKENAIKMEKEELTKREKKLEEAKLLKQNKQLQEKQIQEFMLQNNIDFLFLNKCAVNKIESVCSTLPEFSHLEIYFI